MLPILNKHTNCIEYIFSLHILIDFVLLFDRFFLYINNNYFFFLSNYLNYNI